MVCLGFLLHMLHEYISFILTMWKIQLSSCQLSEAEDSCIPLNILLPCPLVIKTGTQFWLINKSSLNFLGCNIFKTSLKNKFFFRTWTDLNWTQNLLPVILQQYIHPQDHTFCTFFFSVGVGPVTVATGTVTAVSTAALTGGFCSVTPADPTALPVAAAGVAGRGSWGFKRVRHSDLMRLLSTSSSSNFFL